VTNQDQDKKPETLDLAKVRQSLKGQVLRLRTNLKAGATCGNYNTRLC